MARYYSFTTTDALEQIEHNQGDAAISSKPSVAQCLHMPSAIAVSESLGPIAQALETLAASTNASTYDMEDEDFHSFSDGSHSEYRDSDEGSDKDYTACSAEEYGYCGHCGY